MPNIHALGDCISIGEQALRFIELIAGHVTGGAVLPYVVTRPPVRVKTGSRPFTV